MTAQSETWFQPKLRPLPRRALPVQDETLRSYVGRLASANHIRAHELIGYLNPKLAGSHGIVRRVNITLDALTVVSGIDAINLAHALPEIRSQFGDQESLRVLGRTTAGEPNKQRRACRRCLAAKSITTSVRIWARQDQNVCLRHHLWISQGVNDPEDQVDVTDFPEISQAQIRHSNLIRRHGHQRVRHFYWTAEKIIDWSSNVPSPTARWERKRWFFTRERARTLPWSYDYAAYYPEVVDVLSVLTSPYWRRMTISDNPTDEERFYRQIAANGLTNGEPARNTPLNKWVSSHRDSRTPDDPDGEKYLKRWSFGPAGVEPDDPRLARPYPIDTQLRALRQWYREREAARSADTVGSGPG